MIWKRLSAAWAGIVLWARNILFGVAALAVFATRVAIDLAVSPLAQTCRPVAAALLTLLIASILAATQANAAAGSTIDVQPFLAQIIDLAITVTGPPLALLIVGLIFRAYQWLGVSHSAAKDAQIQATVDQVMGHAANFARGKVGSIGVVPVDLRSDAVAHMAEYAMQAMPGTLKKLGIADKASARLKAMAEARLGSETGPVSVYSAF